MGEEVSYFTYLRAVFSSIPAFKAAFDMDPFFDISFMRFFTC